VNRNRLFYCTHQNRKNAFSKKHILNQKLSEKEIIDQIFESAFGFCRIRRSLKENIHKILSTMVQKQRKFDYNYYLTKNCPLPNGWYPEIKNQMLSDMQI
jgi:hypothetical protein